VTFFGATAASILPVGGVAIVINCGTLCAFICVAADHFKAIVDWCPPTVAMAAVNMLCSLRLMRLLMFPACGAVIGFLTLCTVAILVQRWYLKPKV
jgi:hypothetical protein